MLIELDRRTLLKPEDFVTKTWLGLVLATGEQVGPRAECVYGVTTEVLLRAPRRFAYEGARLYDREEGGDAVWKGEFENPRYPCFEQGQDVLLKITWGLV